MVLLKKAQTSYLTLYMLDGGGKFGQYKMMQKPEKGLKLWHMGTHLRVLIKSMQ